MATVFNVTAVYDGAYSDGTVAYEGIKKDGTQSVPFNWYIGNGHATLYIDGVHIVTLRPIDVHYEKVGDHTDLQVYIGVFLMFHLVLPPEMVE